MLVSSNLSTRILWLVVVASSGLAGCSGRGDKPELGFVDGTIQLDGKPLADAVVFFSPEEGGRTSVGHTDSEGKYQLSYIGNDPGAKVGKHTIRITTSQEIDDPKTGRTIHTREKVPDRYNAHSELTKEIEPGPNSVDLDLKSK
ncbi:MAG: carboxypeptidase regulatory-like domain-containing protein [Planctomycetota bacterium]